MTPPHISSGMNLRDALYAARRLGCLIDSVRRAGEVRVSHPRLGRAIRLSTGRKDCGRALTVALRRLTDPASGTD